MKYVSTRGSSGEHSAAEAIALGLAPDGGLFTPVSFPQLSQSDFEALYPMQYDARAARILSLFLDDYSEEELSEYTKVAYSAQKFNAGRVAPVVKLSDQEYMLELWHGPTCAFKDMALQLLPHLMTAALRKTGEKRTACILVATSGDTGKAALEGFCDVDGTQILVFYPENGVSTIQKLQMTTQAGNNVGVVAIRGNFDDAQTGVKEIFSDDAIERLLDQNGKFFSSANSINWGRLVPQIAYYISAYCDMVVKGEIAYGDKVNICVPTGNFGNILAAYIGMRMGLPVNRLICASNSNNVLTDFFLSGGRYNANRRFYETMSPSMDILVSSNLERLLYYASEENSAYVAELMEALAEKREYVISAAMAEEISAVFDAGMCDEASTAATIEHLFRKENYLCDPHTAVAVDVYRQYARRTGDQTKTIIASTASPFKFCASVLRALGEDVRTDGPELIGLLELKTGRTAPLPLSELSRREVRFRQTVNKEEITKAVMQSLQIEA